MVLVLNVLNWVLSILVLLTLHVTTRTHTIVARLGVTRHRIAYFPARAVKIARAQTKRFASPTHRATIMIHSCAEAALRMPLPVSGLVRLGAAANVPMASLVIPTRHAQHQEHRQGIHLMGHRQAAHPAGHRQGAHPAGHQGAHLQDSSLQIPRKTPTFQRTPFSVANPTLMLQLSAHFHVQLGQILNALLVSNVSQILRVTTEKHIIAV